MKIKTVKKITDCKFVNLFSISYLDREDRNKEWIFASRSTDQNPLAGNHSAVDAVVVVPYHKKEDKLVLIKEFRVALGDYQYGFPAGLIDKGESAEEAGRRELFEETGLVVTQIRDLSPAAFSSSGLTDESIFLLYVECEGRPSSRFNEASEDIEVVMVSQSMARDMIRDSKIKFDVKTWIILKCFASGWVL